MTDTPAPRLAVVETLYDTNCRSIPAMLREAADSIEQGDPDEAPVAAVAVFRDADGTLGVYGWGETDDLHAIGLIELGKHELMSRLV